MNSTHGAFNELLYYSGEGGFNEDDIEALDFNWRTEGGHGDKYDRPSIYVAIFEKMVTTVYEGEEHLLTNAELRILRAFSKLAYVSRYCLVRLILRKTSTWHTVKSMEKFKSEVGEDGLNLAIHTLCQPIKDEAEIKQEVKEEPLPEDSFLPEAEVIDLVSDSEEEEVKSEGFPSGQLGMPEDPDIKPSLDALLHSHNLPPYEPNFSFFLEDESSMSLEEVLHRLNNAQLQELVRETKTSPNGKTKSAMIYALLRYSQTQTPLKFQPGSATERRRKSGKGGLMQTLLPFKSKAKAVETQERHLMKMALTKLGKSVRVNIDLYWLIVRLNVIYERSTDYPKSLLVPSLLTSFRKRTYPSYTYARDTSIWSTREELMEYVEAMRLEAAIEAELETLPHGRGSSKTPAPFHRPALPNTSRSMTTPLRTSKTPAPFHTPDLPNTGRSVTTPLRTPMSTGREIGSSPVKKDPDCDDLVVLDTEKPSDSKADAARRVKKIFDEVLLPKWRALVELKRAQGAQERAPGLERFEPGFIYTRLFGKAMNAMATLKLFQEEFDTLSLLLDQTFWRQGKRARWYDRRALLQTTYLCRDLDDPDNKTKNLNILHQAMEGVKQALEDPVTHLVHRPGLVRRLVRLEKTLKVAEEDRCQCSAMLRKADTVQFCAERIYTSNKSLQLDAHGMPIKNKDKDVCAYFSPNLNATNAPLGKATNDTKTPETVKTPSTNWKWKGKSIWRGRDDEQVNVEQRALQYYEDLGFKGFHSETRILTTLFALLFWDIIFADVPGAFETPHQVAPLDLTEDSFYHARKNLIETRLVEVKQTDRALEIVQHHDDLYREKNTWCVGVRWEICSKEHLLEIVKCIGGEPLSIICRLFCEDYGGRSSGVPDLIVWDSTKGICKFVEVKGPGDSASDNQKLWFDSLLGAGAKVEVCMVFDKNKPPKSTKPKRAGTKPVSSDAKGKQKETTDSNGDVDYDLLDLDHQDDELSGPPPILRKRQRPPDENEKADILPTFFSSTRPPASPSPSTVIRRPNRLEVVISTPPVKRRRLSSSQM